jgi:Flp pilus assembly protein TadG
MEIREQNASSLVRNARRSRKTGERGGAILEFAFIMVMTFVLIFAIIDFARAFYSYHFLSEVAREATRFASVRGKASCGTSVTPCNVGQAEIEDYVETITPQGIDPSQVTVTPQWPKVGPPLCDGTPNPGCPVQVTVTYRFNFIFPANFYNLPPISFMPGYIDMSSTSQLIISR